MSDNDWMVLFGRNGFVVSDNEMMLKEALVTLAARLTDSSISQAPLHEIAR